MCADVSVSKRQNDAPQASSRSACMESYVPAVACVDFNILCKATHASSFVLVLVWTGAHPRVSAGWPWPTLLSRAAHQCRKAGGAAELRARAGGGAGGHAGSGAPGEMRRHTVRCLALRASADRPGLHSISHALSWNSPSSHHSCSTGCTPMGG